MANTVSSINPTSTAQAYAPDFRGEAKNTFAFSLPTTVSASFTLPKCESFPATYLFIPDGARTLKSVLGFVTALNASTVQVHGAGTGFSTAASATADHVVIAISSGAITCTNATTSAATAATTYTVVRVS